ncbi:alpha/beta fold hydrolase [Gordonia sp. PDNC005]|uniref:alpha/beta hydrolase family protein n=1 Tax=unclassified Gordonia (in: high G+C Gram-positive bacteria) TaxID=2657482 RepID=UPI001965C86A|nr:alpha/beta fold hydrolase [Gordonia sp. PDNC005]QRY61055.1 alpha/beta fold hydrolase [Gordonia sp. PDNC005]
MGNIAFTASEIDADGVRADIIAPAEPRGTVILAHGAGSNRSSVLLRALSEALVARGLVVARIDLPYRQQRPKGPPSPARSGTDREGIRAAVDMLRETTSGPLIIGGQSYGGRQASMVAADDPRICDGLLLTSYPLHPPGKPEKARTEHLPQIVAPTLIVHGRTDAFGTSDEFADAITLFGGPVRLLEIEKADHSLKPDRSGVGPATAAAAEEWLLPAAITFGAGR